MFQMLPIFFFFLETLILNCSLYRKKKKGVTGISQIYTYPMNNYIGVQNQVISWNKHCFLVERLSAMMPWLIIHAERNTPAANIKKISLFRIVHPNKQKN